MIDIDNPFSDWSPSYHADPVNRYGGPWWTAGYFGTSWGHNCTGWERP